MSPTRTALAAMTLALLCIGWLIASGSASVEERGFGAPPIDNPVEVEAKSVTVGGVGWSVAVVKCDSCRVTEAGPSFRQMTHVYGSGGPGSEATPSRMKIVRSLPGGADLETFNLPSLISGWAYCRLHPDSTFLHMKEKLADAKKEKERIENFPGEVADRDKARLTDLDWSIRELEHQMQSREQTTLWLSQPDERTALPWWPIVVSHYIDGGASGTDLLVQVIPQDAAATQRVRIFLPVGEKASLKYRDANGYPRSETLLQAQYAEFEITDRAVKVEVPPRLVSTNPELNAFMTSAGEVFFAATGLAKAGDVGGNSK